MSTLIEFVWVGIGGMLGAIARYGIGLFASNLIDSDFPWGTLTANVLGCFLLGMLIGSGAPESDQRAKLLLGVGFLGSLTTFSTFGAETIHHATHSHWSMPAGNLFGNLVVGFLAVCVGMYVGRRFWGS